MTNPYQTPAFDPKQFQNQPGYFAGGSGDFGWVRQIRTFAILNAVQGMLEIPMGLLMTGMSALFPTIISKDLQQKAEPGDAANQEAMMWVVAGIYLAIGLPVLLTGILRIIAGVQNYRFKGRTLSLVSIIGGMATLLSCYCAPTAVGLLVYGLILHLNPGVRAAFELGRQGHSADQILAGFAAVQPGYFGSFPPPVGPPPGGGERPFGSG